MDTLLIPIHVSSLDNRNYTIDITMRVEKLFTVNLDNLDKFAEICENFTSGLDFDKKRVYVIYEKKYAKRDKDRFTRWIIEQKLISLNEHTIDSVCETIKLCNLDIDSRNHGIVSLKLVIEEGECSGEVEEMYKSAIGCTYKTELFS